MQTYTVAVVNSINMPKGKLFCSLSLLDT